VDEVEDHHQVEDLVVVEVENLLHKLLFLKITQLNILQCLAKEKHMKKCIIMSLKISIIRLLLRLMITRLQSKKSLTIKS